MDLDAFQTQLLNHIAENYDIDIEDIDNEMPLFSSNIVDSFGMLDIVAFVEQEAKVKFGVLDMHLDNLDSVDRILAFVRRARG